MSLGVGAGQTKGPVVCPGSQRTKVLEMGNWGCVEEQNTGEDVPGISLCGVFQPLTSVLALGKGQRTGERNCVKCPNMWWG